MLATKNKPFLTTSLSGTAMIKAVIFDMDGVVADTEPLHQKADFLTFKKYGVKIRKSDLRDCVGRHADFLVRKFKKKYAMKESVMAIRREKKKNARSLLKKSAKPVPGAKKLISELKKKKFKIALASSSSRGTIAVVLKKLGLTGKFNAIVGGNEVRKSKPDPEIFLKAAKKLKLN